MNRKGFVIFKGRTIVDNYLKIGSKLQLGYLVFKYLSIDLVPGSYVKFC